MIWATLACSVDLALEVYKKRQSKKKRAGAGLQTKIAMYKYISIPRFSF